MPSRIGMFADVRPMKEFFRKLLGKTTDARALLLGRHRKAPESENALILVDQPGFEKMSQVILDFAQPWLKDAEDEDDMRGILSAAIFAWNLSLLSEKDCGIEFQKHLVPKLPRQHQITMRKMITRKRTHFASNHRAIIDYQIGTKGDALDLHVVTTLEP
jgi:hypothetical protein